MNRVGKLTCVLGTQSLFLIAGVANANICDEMSITPEWFDRAESSSSEAIAEHFVFQMCNTSFDSYREFREHAEDSGFSIGVANFAFGYDESEASRTENFEEHHRNNCRRERRIIDRVVANHSVITNLSDNLIELVRVCAVETQGIFAPFPTRTGSRHFEMYLDIRPGDITIQNPLVVTSNLPRDLSCESHQVPPSEDGGLSIEIGVGFVPASNEVIIRCHIDEGTVIPTDLDALSVTVESRLLGNSPTFLLPLCVDEECFRRLDEIERRLDQNTQDISSIMTGNSVQLETAIINENSCQIVGPANFCFIVGGTIPNFGCRVAVLDDAEANRRSEPIFWKLIAENNGGGCHFACVSLDRDDPIQLGEVNAPPNLSPGELAPCLDDPRN